MKHYQFEHGKMQSFGSKSTELAKKNKIKYWSMQVNISKSTMTTTNTKGGLHQPHLNRHLANGHFK